MSPRHPTASRGPVRARFRPSAASGEGSIYTPRYLRYVYDPMVIHFANRFTWRCPSREILRLYDAFAARTHLEIGPGTAWFLEKATLPTSPSITLLDVNEDVLNRAADRLAKYRPTAILADALDPGIQMGPFDSIAMTHVLHCLPAPLSSKGRVFDAVALALAPDGTFFGSTILGSRAAAGCLARMQIRQMNRQGVFDNADDDLVDLGEELSKRFETVHLDQVGSIALFVASGPRVTA